MHKRRPVLLPLILALLSARCGGELPDAEPDPDQPSVIAQSCRGAPYPVILAHGMAGWDKVGGFWNYFYQVADDLRARGERVYTTQVAPFDSSAVRGAQLAKAIDNALSDSGACKVNVIAHSQGGLDARYAISTMRRGDRVAALVTVASPHRGSPVADVALGLIPGVSYSVIDAVLSAYAKIVGAPSGSPGLRAQLKQLTTTETQGVFNPRNQDDPRVAYYSIAGRSALRIADDDCQGGLWQNPQRGDVLDLLFTPTQVVFALKNPLDPTVNDGMVAVSSARWGRFLGCVPADHLDEIGQFFHVLPDVVSGYDHKAMYRKVVAQLRKDGF